MNEYRRDREVSEGKTVPLRAADPGFITHRELDPLIGYPRKRERWQDAGHLPPALRVEGFRQRALLFPRFVLACLVLERSRARTEPALRSIHDACDAVYRSNAVGDLERTIKKVLAGTHKWGLAELVDEVSHSVPDAFFSWRAEVTAQESRLNEAGIYFVVSLGRVRATRGQTYFVDYVGTGNHAEYPSETAPRALERGAWVSCQHVLVGPRSRDFLLPISAPDEVDLDDPDDDLVDWFRQTLSRDPRPAVPELEDPSEEEPIFHRPPLIASPEAWRGGSAMSRRPAPADP